MNIRRRYYELVVNFVITSSSSFGLPHSHHMAMATAMHRGGLDLLHEGEDGQAGQRGGDNDDDGERRRKI